MANKPTQRTESTPQWIGYIMFAGLVCILIGIVALSLAHDRPALTDVANIIGYLGLALVLISTFIHISSD